MQASKTPITQFISMSPRQNSRQIQQIVTVGLLIFLLGLVLTACGDSAVSPQAGSVISPGSNNAGTSAATVVPTVTKIGFNYTRKEVADLLRKEGATLNLYWPAGGSIKTWLVDKLVPGYKQFIKENYGLDMAVNLLPSSGGDSAFFLKLQAYEAANGGSESKRNFEIDAVRVVPSADLVAAGEKGWLTPVLPAYSTILPNLAKVNLPGIASFTTIDSSGHSSVYAVPVYQPTISFFYNKEKVPNPPQSLKELKEWVKANPGRFTYEDPRSSSGIGSGAMFLTAVMKAFGDPARPETFDKGIEYLKELQASIYPQPTESAQMVDLMKREDVWLMVFWNDFGLSVARDQNITFMANYFPEDGMPVRNTPLAVPRAAQHQLAGLLFMDYALSDTVQKDLALITQQIPASTSSQVWDNLPKNTFGYDFGYITKRTFAAFNSTQNLTGIKVMVERYTRQVLGK